jgi:hypothetical protein
MTYKRKKFWEELIAYLIWHGPRWKRRNQQFFCCCMYIRYWNNVSTKPLPSNDREFLPSRCLATIGEFLPSHCLATIGEFLPSRCLATIRTHTQTATWSHKPTVFIQNKESRLKKCIGHKKYVSFSSTALFKTFLSSDKYLTSCIRGSISNACTSSWKMYVIVLWFLTEACQQILIKFCNINYMKVCVSVYLIVTCRQTENRTDRKTQW